MAEVDTITRPQVVLDGERAYAALSASWEIEHLCGVLRSTDQEDFHLAVRGIVFRIEELSQSIMSAIDDQEMVTTDEIYFNVFHHDTNGNEIRQEMEA